MVHYRRNRVPGGTYFFTVTLADRRSAMLVEQIDALRTAVRAVKALKSFTIEAWVVLPDHLHALWRLPEGDTDYSSRWQAIKATFTRTVIRNAQPVSRNAKGECNLWQRRYWEHTIRDERDFEKHVDYIHYNPVKHGLVESVQQWPYSTFHLYVRNGIYTPDWAGSDVEKGEGFGEPW